TLSSVFNIIEKAKGMRMFHWRMFIKYCHLYLSVWKDIIYFNLNGLTNLMARIDLSSCSNLYLSSAGSESDTL
ncbi:TPA: hypothetical protein ACH5I5_002782, partial [Klebsiella variicola]